MANYKDRFVATGGQTAFVLSDTPANDTAIITSAGREQDPTVDYTISGTDLTFAQGRNEDEIVLATYRT